MEHILIAVCAWIRDCLYRRPIRTPEQITPLHRLARLAMGVTLSLLIISPIVWLVFWR